MPRIKRPQDDGPRRSHSIWFAVVAVLCVLAAGTAKVQLWPDRRIVQQSQKQYWANVAVSASRGRIEDRNGIPLAISVPTTSFFIDPKYWDPASADKLAPTFGKETVKKFSRQLPGRFHWVGRNLPKEKADPLEAKKIPGLYTLSEKQRIYPHESLAFHVLGFCDIDEYGQAGVELAWNHILYSPPRTRFLTRDSKGKTMDIMGGKSGIVKDTAHGRLDKAHDRFKNPADTRMASQRRREGRERGMGGGRLRRSVQRRNSRARKLSDAQPQRQKKSLQHGRGAQQRARPRIRARLNIQADHHVDSARNWRDVAFDDL